MSLERNPPVETEVAGPTGRIRLNDAAPPVPIPAGHIGPIVLPGTGRMVWWTGRVAIGLRHEAPPRAGGLSQAARWVQEMLLAA